MLKILNNQVYVLKGKVVRIYLNKVSFLKIVDNKEASEECIQFDYLVLALGSSYNHPFQTSNFERAAQINSLQETHNKTKDVKNILVIGGGAVGIELGNCKICITNKKKFYYNYNYYKSW